MRNLLLLALAAASAVSVAGVRRDAAVGTYRLVPDEATRAFCRRHNLPLPSGRLTLRADRTFSLVVNDDEGVHRTLGQYVDRDGTVSFRIEEGDGFDLPREMRLRSGTLSGRGVSYERAETAVVRPAPRPSAPPVPVETAPVFGRAVEGTWTLHRNGQEEADTRFTFAPDGTFRFRGMNSTSAGRYAVDGGEIVLTWAEIDGERVAAGQRVQKRLPFVGGAFFVDTYEYRRQR